jgi:hypothetical protein
VSRASDDRRRELRRHDRYRSEALSITCPSCGAPPAVYCRVHRYGYMSPPRNPQGWRAKWNAYWCYWTPRIHIRRYLESARRGTFE